MDPSRVPFTILSSLNADPRRSLMAARHFATLVHLSALGLIACGARTDLLASDETGSGGASGGGCSIELCNGVDDDCDGQIDEESQSVGAPCLTDLPGICALGAVVCENGELACAPENSGAQELCNGVDDNCDGQIDEQTTEPEPCPTGQPGICSLGFILCEGGQPVCSPESGPTSEACNALDDDCNGVVDDSIAGIGDPCPTGEPGICATGTLICEGGVSACLPDNAPSDELCNTVDDDCDGEVDEGVVGMGVPCTTGQPGVCATGEVVCQAGVILCQADKAPSMEICNGLDDDCDGKVDEECQNVNGCSDGTREGFVNVANFPNIASCAGGFALPGLLAGAPPKCNRNAGNTSANPEGQGCTAEDLCSVGFHVCQGAQDVAAHSPTGCTGASAQPSAFFTTRQGSTGCTLCALGDNTDPGVCTGCSCEEGCKTSTLTGNDLFGCGTLGLGLPNCGVLTRTSGNNCASLGFPWSCGDDGCAESANVTKPAPNGGGVLCCRD
jgi:hypothetical protein